MKKFSSDLEQPFESTTAIPKELNKVSQLKSSLVQFKTLKVQTNNRKSVKTVYIKGRNGRIGNYYRAYEDIFSDVLMSSNLEVRFDCIQNSLLKILNN